MPAGSITTDPAEDFTEYWTAYSDAVVCENQLEAAAAAAVYASLINAPLFIAGVDDPAGWQHKYVIGVGNTGTMTAEEYTVDELMLQYSQATSTNKLIIANPGLNNHITETKTTRYSGVIDNLYGNSVLAAPVLAAYRKELLCFVYGSSIDAIDMEIDDCLDSHPQQIEYLTIMGSPLEIQQNVLTDQGYFKNGEWVESWYYRQFDETRYGNTDNDPTGFAELKTGRIYGFSVSDISAYLSRVVFYSDLPKAGEYMFIPGRSNPGCSCTGGPGRYISLFEDTQGSIRESSVPDL